MSSVFKPTGRAVNGVVQSAAGRRRPLGYTIVEVMIVLAVSGVMFLLAASFVNGKQQSTAFTDGANEMASRIQDVIDQVNDGQYSDVPFSCSYTGGSLTITAPPPGSPTTSAGSPASVSTLAGNSDCTFVGKFLHFNVNNSPTAYETFTLAGARLSATGGPVYQLSSADVAPVYSTLNASPGSPSPYDLTVQNQQISQGLSVVRITVYPTGAGSQSAVYQAYNGAAATNTGFGFGILESFGSQLSGSAGSYNNGSESNSLVYAAIGPNDGEAAAAAALTASATFQPLAPADQAVLCLTDGTRYATITVDAQHATAQITGETPC